MILFKALLNNWSVEIIFCPESLKAFYISSVFMTVKAQMNTAITTTHTSAWSLLK